MLHDHRPVDDHHDGDDNQHHGTVWVDHDGVDDHDDVASDDHEAPYKHHGPAELDHCNRPDDHFRLESDHHLHHLDHLHYATCQRRRALRRILRELP